MFTHSDEKYKGHGAEKLHWPIRRYAYSKVTRAAFITKVLYAPNIDMMK